MQIRVLVLAAIVWLSGLLPALAQFKEGGDDGGSKAGESQVSRWKVGMVVRASGGACRGLAGYAAVPTNWPEQEVTVVEEDVSPEVKIKYEMIGNDVKIMAFKIGQVASGQEVKALVTFEVRRSGSKPPEKTDQYVIPDAKKLPREIRPYLQPSPQIECRDPKIRELAKKVGVDKKAAWDHVEAIYDWVWNHIKDKDGPGKGALGALKDGSGDCEERSSLFIAICRAAEIPARTVWVPGHCYSEFYLEDADGKGHWFPCQSRGAKEFGGITDLRPIFQKGDNIRPPRNGSKERQRFLAESLTGASTPGGGRPQVKFLRQAVAN
jgi:hypothetical protein